MAGDLDGLSVVSVEQAVAAPYLTSRLADAGARVIKVERPEGDFARGYDHLVHGESAYFVWLNRGKESICLDLRLNADRALLERMAAAADVFVQNLAPGAIGLQGANFLVLFGAIDRLGFAPERLRRDHPRLITVSISGYGDEGPFRDLKAYDLLVQAETGLSSITGTPDAMARVGVSVCDIAAGMTAFQAVLQALIGRGATGEGRHVAVSLFHALADWMNVPYLQHVYGGVTPRRSGLNHPTIAPYGAYACSDGRAVLFSIQNEREWVNLCRDVLELPEVATDDRFSLNVRRVANRAALDRVIEGVFALHDRDAMVDRLERGRIAYGRVSTMEDLAAHPQNRRITVDTPSGPVTCLAPGALHDGALPAFRPVPGLGQHTAALRDEFGGIVRAAE